MSYIIYTANIFIRGNTITETMEFNVLLNAVFAMDKCVKIYSIQYVDYGFNDDDVRAGDIFLLQLVPF